MRESEDGDDLGYRFITRGWYDLQDNDFTYYFSDVFLIDNYFIPSIDVLYASKEELRPSIIDFFRTPTANLTFSSDGRQFEFVYECLDFFTECAPPKTYVKVN